MLDAYAARSCPVKTYNAFDPFVEQPSVPDDESLRESFQGGRAYRELVLDHLAANPDAVDLRECDPAARQSQTLAALAAGASVVVAPKLPADREGGRSGQPDALVRDDGAPDEAPGYWPLKVKPYRVTEKETGSTQLLGSVADSIARRSPTPGLRFRSYREGVLLELAHHWRMLEALGYATHTPWACVVGQSRNPDSKPRGTWLLLSNKFIRTFSRTAGYKLRSPLERYDHEFRFRLHVAESAIQHTPDDDAPPVVRPIRVKECEWCPWWQVCLPRMDRDDLSLRISKAPLDVRELQTLAGLGIHTVPQLAEADIDAILPAYLPQTTHRDRSEQRLRQAARRARMLAKNVSLERISTEPIAVPRATVEVDLDIETNDDGLVYLWGALVSAPGESPRYVAFSRFEALRNSDEVRLAEEFAEWLCALHDEHPDLLVYHYSDYETVHLRQLSQRSRNPALKEAVTLIPDHFVDLFRYTRDNFVGVDGLGLKVVATEGAGFHWRDEEPGGLASIAWFTQAISDPDPAVREAARIRVMQYNEDDVRATLALREWFDHIDADA
ncbi:TM0106 family RecB-like putative nuclease [Tessaracoccus caeni]|uniref:TM0106 family RecB-like putative nuclease n=1 Tax=Tessaracoccus caeni TaxID=3031239 RepID=UPI0023DB212D|nr:TM0106 family RecB-like putative nuclease [Tessaracoccus caeni]MDF1487066.1 TM0106 family RecB-like putative nuclease [Tessaracoccus caeni]